MAVTFYSIATDFVKGLGVNAVLLHSEIIAGDPTPTAVFQGVIVGKPTSDDVQVITNTTPSAGEKTALDAIIAAHPATTIPGTSSGSGAADQSQANEIPGEFFLGELLDYGSKSIEPDSEIQYTRIFFPKDLIIGSMQVFVTGGDDVGDVVKMGIYDQADPTNEASIPNARVAQTAAVSITSTANSYVVVSLSADFTVPTAGFYWLAFVTDGNADQEFTSTSVISSNFAPVRRETTATTILPATAGTLTNPSSAIIYVSALEV